METLVLFAVLLLMGKIAGALVERARMPSVVGEILAGTVLTAVAVTFGWSVIEAIHEDHALEVLAELGIILLLFGAGLETSPEEMLKVGVPSLLVACVGVLVPVSAGILVMLAFGADMNLALFAGATLAATSVGITASVFGAAKLMGLPSARIVMGAAVIDDVLGIMILSIVAGIVRTGGVSVGELVATIAKSAGFIATAMLIGPLMTEWISKTLSKISPGHGMKVSALLIMAISTGWLATLVGLEAIIGAFAAGVVLKSVHFKDFYQGELEWKLQSTVWHQLPDDAKNLVEKANHHHVEEITSQFVGVLSTLFFVLVGTRINILDFSTDMIIPVVILTVVAILGKLASGIMAPGAFGNKLFVGLSMIPRGEVGLVFIATGNALGVIPPQWFTALVIVILLSTIVPLAPIAQVGKRLKKAQTPS